MFFLFLYGCNMGSTNESKNSYEDMDGEELLEEYNTAICNVYLQDGCVEAFNSCNEPVGNYGSWENCMTSQQVSQSHCSNLPLLFEDDPQSVMECVEELTMLNCNNEPENACVGDDALFQVGSCGDVLRILLQNCSAFGP